MSAYQKVVGQNVRDLTQRNKAIDGIKLLACGAMLLDHLRFVWPGLVWLYFPGRLAFPLFLLAYGYTVRQASLQSVKRLVLWGCLVWPAHHFLMSAQLNILFTFAVGGLVALFPPLLILPAQFPGAIDYGAWGVVAVAMVIWWKPSDVIQSVIAKCDTAFRWVPALPRDFFLWFYAGHLYLLAACKEIMCR